MSIKNYINNYFKRFNNRDYLILQGKVDINEMNLISHKKNMLHNFNKHPIVSTLKLNDVYILISKKNKDLEENKYYNIEMLYNYSQKNNKMHDLPMLISFGIQNFNLYYDNKETKSELGYGVLLDHKLKIHINHTMPEFSELLLEKNKFIFHRQNEFNMFHGEFNVISYSLFNNMTKLMNEKQDIIELNLTYYEDLKKYGTYYCLDPNAIQWSIESGPDYGSYAFSTPPISDCKDPRVNASFIFSLETSDYNEKISQGINSAEFITYITYSGQIGSTLTKFIVNFN
tara:strand:- start:1558 stop:2415 length:858 start_codon:yes stop_codon:yes gene_type:complete